MYVLPKKKKTPKKKKKKFNEVIVFLTRVLHRTKMVLYCCIHTKNYSKATVHGITLSHSVYDKGTL